MTSRGALANDTKSGREAIGRSRGGLTTKIHLAADLRCRPVARLTSCGQHGDSPRFVPLMDAIRIRPPRPGQATAAARPSVAALPEAPDLAVVTVPAARVVEVAQECGRRGARSLVVITSGLTRAAGTGPPAVGSAG